MTKYIIFQNSIGGTGVKCVKISGWEYTHCHPSSLAQCQNHTSPDGNLSLDAESCHPLLLPEGLTRISVLIIIVSYSQVPRLSFHQISYVEREACLFPSIPSLVHSTQQEDSCQFGEQFCVSETHSPFLLSVLYPRCQMFYSLTQENNHLLGLSWLKARARMCHLPSSLTILHTSPLSREKLEKTAAGSCPSPNGSYFGDVQEVCVSCTGLCHCLHKKGVQTK